MLRQGDVWLVELKRGRDNLNALPGSHAFDARARVLRHPQHGELSIPFPVRAHLTLSVSGASVV